MGGRPRAAVPGGTTAKGWGELLRQGRSLGVGFWRIGSKLDDLPVRGEVGGDVLGRRAPAVFDKLSNGPKAKVE